MSEINDNKCEEKNHSVASWYDPYTKNQKKFFMVALYEGLRDGEHNFDTKFVGDGNELFLLMLSDDVAIERIYVVSFPESGKEKMIMEYIDELWVGVLNQQSQKTGLAYMAITENNTEHTFTRFGEVAASHIKGKTLAYSSKVNEKDSFS